LAESWKGSEDKLTWTYKLRDGLKWSDGKPLTSEDIAWTVNT
jgi:peptide/nickel transport system substrate-binding protein